MINTGSYIRQNGKHRQLDRSETESSKKKKVSTGNYRGLRQSPERTVRTGSYKDLRQESRRKICTGSYRDLRLNPEEWLAHAVTEI